MRFKYNTLEEPVFVFENNQDMVEWINPEDYVVKSGKFVGSEKLDLDSWDSAKLSTNLAWGEGQKIILELKEELKGLVLPEIKSKKRKTEFSSEDGEEVDLERLYSGLDFFRTVNREVSKGSNDITLVINPGTPFFIDSKDVFWRGAAALALTDILEDAGYSVELWVATKTDVLFAGSGACHTGCRLKKSNDPLDISTLANVLSGWFYRSVQFAMFSSMATHFDKKISTDYGRPLIPTLKDLKQYSPDENLIHVAGFYEKKTARQVIERELSRIQEKQ